MYTPRKHRSTFKPVRGGLVGEVMLHLQLAASFYAAAVKLAKMDRTIELSTPKRSKR